MPRPKGLKWSKRCTTCQFMKNNARFRHRIYNSTFFYPDSHESVLDILEDFDMPVSVSMCYRHLKDHKFAQVSGEKKLAVAQKRILEETKEQAKEIVTKALEGEVLDQLTDKAQHIQTLDAIISQGRENILKGNVKLRTSDILAAIKIKADIEKGSKDRTADLVKTLAGLAAPK